ncbi:MAG: hypothetical protein CUN55_20045, partial [Phototrophicales bacterium]
MMADPSRDKYLFVERALHDMQQGYPVLFNTGKEHYLAIALETMQPSHLPEIVKDHAWQCYITHERASALGCPQETLTHSGAIAIDKSVIECNDIAKLSGKNEEPLHTEDIWQHATPLS